MARRDRGNSSAPAPSAPPALAPDARDGRRFTRADALAIAVVVIAAVLVFLPSVRYPFVYDDNKQITDNILLQDASYFWKAMRSDVWAFRPSWDGGATSHYWRPTFILWLMANYRLFGVESTVGWHASSIFLHALASALAYLVVRRHGAGRAVAAAIGLVFAAHPVHAESVAWISGSPDPLMAATLFPAWLLALSARERGSWWRWGASWALFALGLLSKETAVTFALVLAVSFFATDERALPARARWLSALRLSLPYFGLVGLYLLARVGVFGSTVRGDSPAGVLVDSALTAPSVAAFYIRQCVAPWGIGPSYPLRPVTAATLGMWSFGVPLLVTAGFTAFALWRGKRDRIAWVGLALAAAMVAPTMKVDTFTPDQIVHDRYLYIALLGGLMVLLPAAAAGISALLRRPERVGAGATLAGAVVACVPLSVWTVEASRAYESNLALWQAGVRSDPTSDFTWRQLAGHLQKVGRIEEAREALDKSISIRPRQSSLIGRADMAMARKDWTGAVRDLQEAVRWTPPNFAAFERLAVSLDALGKTEDAVRALRDARAKIPGMKCSITERIALYLQRAGDLEGAARELESVRSEAKKEVDARSRLCLFRLGGIYVQLDREADALRAYEEFLASSDALQIPAINEARAFAEKVVARMRKSGAGAPAGSP